MKHRTMKKEKGEEEFKRSRKKKKKNEEVEKEEEQRRNRTKEEAVFDHYILHNLFFPSFHYLPDCGINTRHIFSNSNKMIIAVEIRFF